jgi:tRNA pseudouridine38-40 synthase
MNEAAKYFLGEHDFKGFKASGTSSKSSVRTIYEAKVYKEKDRIIIGFDDWRFCWSLCTRG